MIAPPARAYAGRFIFDHLPKTGGSAITAWLEQTLGTGCVSPHLDGEHATLIRQMGGQYSVLCGHISYESARGTDPRYQYATLLREPLDRVVSWLYFVDSNHADTELLGLVPLVRRFLASDGADLPNELLPHISNNYVEHFCRVHGDGRQVPAERLQHALAALQCYDIVGTHDAMPAFLTALAGRLDAPAPPPLARVNVTRRRPATAALPAALHARLVELNTLDLALYAAARAMPVQRAVAPARWQPYARAPARNESHADVQLTHAAMREAADIRAGAPIHVDIDFVLARAVPQLLLGIHVFDSDARLAYGVHSGMLDQLGAGLDAGAHSATFAIHADLPAGKYTLGIALVEECSGTERTLLWRDAVCAFSVHSDPARRSIGYADLRAGLAVDTPAQREQARPIDHAAGHLRCLAPPTRFRADSLIELDVEVANQSAQTWHSGRHRPVMLSYHWLGADGAVRHFDGLRTPLPSGQLAAGASCRARMQVHTPAELDDHVLVLTAVQEHVGWLETRGFSAARLAASIA